MPLSDDIKIVVAVTTTNGAAGTSAITSAAVDTAGFLGCLFIVPLGPIVGTAVTSLKVQQSSDDAATDTYDDLTGSNQTIADTDDDGVKYVDINRPGKRYLKMVISRGTANATIGSVLAILYNTRHRPVTQAAAVVGETFVSPVEGTP
jgi:hypothetical protein